MKRKKSSTNRLFGFGLLALLVFIGSSLLWWRWATAPADSASSAAQIFVIPRGQGIDAIGDRLYQAELIRSPAAFKIMVFKNHLAKKIQAGDFRLKPSMDLNTITQELTHGTLDIWVTLLEGWRQEEIANKIEKEFVSKNSEFDKLAFLQATKKDEGYLFPDTYLIPRDASAATIASLLKNTFNKKVDLSQNSSGLSSKQVITLASILEREVRTDKDRPIIAGILIKRLENDWPLQADATVQYAVASKNCRRSDNCTWWPQNLTRADIDLDSPYNTYQNQGLPPTPICSPGLASIKAVLSPKSSAYWFYISDLKGNIRYAETVEDHNANITKYLRK